MSTDSIEQIPLGDLSPETFLAEYWQKKPLLIRQAFPDFESPISPEELAGLACDTEAPSRIIAEKGLEKAWQVKHGPFEDEDFTSLPDTHWTLLVNDLERYYPELKDEITDQFRFIPDWRIDDLMLSFAVKDGSVGPHIDEYDVFLLQAHGQRRWQISNEPVTSDEQLIPDIELKILKTFTPEQEWVLNPGDMLYLPPNVIHHGVALNDCMTFSVGFRAPDMKGLLQMYLEKCDESLTENKRYQDPDLMSQSEAGEIRREHLDKLTQLLRDGLQTDQNIIDTWLGEYLTDPKGEVMNDSIYDDDNSIQAHYQPNQNYQRSSSSRFAYTCYPDFVMFFFNGESQSYSTSLIDSLNYLCNNNNYSANKLEKHIQSNEEFSFLLNHLLTVNAIELSGTEDEIL